MGQVRFANDRYSQIMEDDVKDKIRQNLSIGYRILDYFYENGKKYVNKFSIHEVSLVPIPADANSGFGRSATFDNDTYKIRNVHLEGKNKMNTRKREKKLLKS